MKTLTLLVFACVVGTAVGAAPTAPALSTEPKVGVYDSRALAYAYFWSDAGQKERRTVIAEAKAAEASGDVARYNQLKQQIAEMQKRDHLAVFSTAPAERALAALQDRLPQLAADLGVTRFVSKWDKAAMKRVPVANQIDVTDRLTRELFTPTARQQKVLDSMKSTPPVPLDDARRMAESGDM